MAKTSSSAGTAYYHGVLTFPEYIGSVGGHDIGLVFRRAGWGAIATQEPGTSNWFHMPINSDNTWFAHGSTFTTIYSWSLQVNLALSAETVLDRVHIREGIGRADIVYDSGPIQASQTVYYIHYQTPEESQYSTFNVSMHVAFNGPRSEVTFLGAELHRRHTTFTED